jgi:phosphatidylinositol 4-kinase
MYTTAKGTVHDSPQYKQYNRCLEFRNTAEEVTINQALPANQSPLQAQAKSNDDTMDSVFNKQRRLNYFNDEHQFIWFLTDLSSRLRAYPLGSIRTQRMRSEVENVNTFIPNGVYIPICWMNDSHYRVVRIVSGECCVFSTKERVPYLVYVEALKSPFTVSKPVISYTQENTVGLRDTTELVKPSRHHKSLSVSEEKPAPIVTEEKKDIIDEHQKQALLTVMNENGAQSISVMEKVLKEGETEEERLEKLKREEFERDFKEMENQERERKKREQLLATVDEFVLVDKIGVETDANADRNALMYACYGESFEEKKDRVRKSSPFGYIDGWTVQSFIVKANDDIRQEHFAMQLIDMCHRIFEQEKLPIYVRPYHVIVTDRDCGLIECITDTISIDSLKKKFPNFTSLFDYFKTVFGVPGTPGFRQAQINFIESMAGYSVICYILQIKDRHNGNIMLHRDGHVVHIDFGFLLGNSPGSINFESAPFKLTAEHVEVMGGTNDAMFDHFRMLVFLGLKTLAKHKDQILSLVEMMAGYSFPCFASGPAFVLRELNARFHSDLSERDFAQWARSIVDESLDNWRTRQYDNFQRLTNGIQ